MTKIKKPRKKRPVTPRSKVKSALGKLFLSSRERQATLKRDGYTCTRCGAKQSRAKGREIYVNVHHLDGDAWERIIDLVFEILLVNPDKMVTVCSTCHDREHDDPIQRGMEL